MTIFWDNSLLNNEFYQDCEIEKIEWWISWCNEYPDLYWARLRRFTNDKADVLFQDEIKSFGFDNEEDARHFISEDEFSRFENMDEEDRKDLESHTDLIIKTPTWENNEVSDFEYVGTY